MAYLVINIFTGLVDFTKVKYVKFCKEFSLVLLASCNYRGLQVNQVRPSLPTLQEGGQSPKLFSFICYPPAYERMTGLASDDRDS